MSDDYISRLRGELLRAGATQPARRRTARTLRHLRPLAVAAAIAALVVAVAMTLPDGPEREAAGSARLEYRVAPAGAAEDAAACLRDRLARLGVEDATVTTTPGGLTVTAPSSARADVIALTAPGELAIYDWEHSVLGPRGVPEPEDPQVTGGEDAGHAAAISRREAESRGRAVRGDGDRWFALGDQPALTDKAVARAEAATDPATNEPIVIVQLTNTAQLRFRELTRSLAQDGARLRENQHLAITFDDRLVSVPYINWREAPDGLDGPLQIAGGLTTQSARQLAAILNAGPLPAKLL
jgi:preprotein translocase subunit SecD